MTNIKKQASRIAQSLAHDAKAVFFRRPVDLGYPSSAKDDPYPPLDGGSELRRKSARSEVRVDDETASRGSNFFIGTLPLEDATGTVVRVGAPGSMGPYLS